MASSYSFDFNVKPDTVIAKTLEACKLKQWGFVIYRCTYGSQAKWAKFLALAKQEARNTLEREGTGDVSVYDRMTWTVIEDTETLDGASILEATRNFGAWVKADGRAEMEGSTLTDTCHPEPRYMFFIYVDEESLESVVDEEKAADWTAGFFCKIVFADAVEDREEGRLAGMIPDDQDPLDEKLELLHCVKKVKLGSLVSLYATLVHSPDDWYNIHVDVDYNSVGSCQNHSRSG